MADEIKSMSSTLARQEYVIHNFKLNNSNQKAFFYICRVDIVGACIIAALNDGENGSAWQCENGRIEKLKIVDYPKF